MKGWACLVRAGGIGDNLVAASPARPLKRLGYNVEMITSELCGVVHQNNPFIDKLTIKKDGDIPSESEVNLRWHLSRANEYDIYAHLTHTMEVKHAFFRGTPQFWWPEEVRREMAAGSYLETAHKIAQAPFDFGPVFFPFDEELERAARTRDEQIGGRYVVWVLAGTRIDKMYPWASHVISRIVREMGIPVVLMGEGPNQFEMAQGLLKQIRHQNGSEKDVHLVMTPADGEVSPDGRTKEKGGTMDWPIRRSLTQAQLADLVICPDSGVWWAVCHEPNAKILLLSHASAENIGKHCINTQILHADPDKVPCWPCHRLHDTPETCVQDKEVPAAACMASLTVEMVLEAAHKVLNKKGLRVVEEAA